MNERQKELWMQQNLEMLLERAANMGIEAHIVYAYLNGAAEGIGANLNQDARRLIDEELEDEFSEIYED